MKDYGNIKNEWFAVMQPHVLLSIDMKDKGFYTTGAKAMRDKALWRNPTHDELSDDVYQRIIAKWTSYASGLRAYVMNLVKDVRDVSTELYWCLYKRFLLNHKKERHDIYHNQRVITFSDNSKLIVEINPIINNGSIYYATAIL
jgi:hypothetical protein